MINFILTVSLDSLEFVDRLEFLDPLSVLTDWQMVNLTNWSVRSEWSVWSDCIAWSDWIFWIDCRVWTEWSVLTEWSAWTDWSVGIDWSAGIDWSVKLSRHWESIVIFKSCLWWWVYFDLDSVVSTLVPFWVSPWDLWPFSPWEQGHEFNNWWDKSIYLFYGIL